MKSITFLLLFILINISDSYSQSHHNFNSGKWIGEWTGTLHIYYPVRNLELQAKLEITNTDEPGKLGWKTVYDNGKIEKKYLLKTKDAEKGQYILDEDNTIMLDYYYSDNTFYCVFEVENVLLTSIYRMEGENIIMEVTSSELKNPNISGNNSGDSKEVKSYPVFVVQKAIFSKK